MAYQRQIIPVIKNSIAVVVGTFLKFFIAIRVYGKNECTGTIVSSINIKSLIEPTIIEIVIDCTTIPVPVSV
jgi:hypothetical protein